MDMNVKSSVIKKHRTDKLWSQQHLAKVSGLGLRTIQRLESKGTGSQESLKALASVFEVNANTLFWPDEKFSPYKHKQLGITALSVTAIIGALIIITNDFLVLIPALVLALVVVLLTLVCLLFSSMTIEVNEHEIVWYFGLGMFKKSLLLEEISQCRPVKNPLWMGFGIHAFGTGWIYNISGLLGVEILLKGGALLRLGSDQPNYLSNAIMSAKNRAQ